MVRHQNLAGTTGFEPAISSVTGKHVRPGYTTAPHYKNLEAAARIELANKDVAGLDLTTWLRRCESKIGGHGGI
jgi:hypothetical protein